MNYNDRLKEKQTFIDNKICDYLPKSQYPYNKTVIDAMKYSLMAGGKRLRSILMNEAYQLCSKDEVNSNSTLDAFMVAIEMIHTYSLIHDDLPAMDNDELRRGMPTCHIKFGEDMAILAGDALLNRAYEIMVEAALSDNINALKAMQVIANASGVNGMVGGQVADIESEGKDINIDCLNYIHLHKTSALIEASLMAGAYLASADERVVDIFRSVGRDIGLAFQIQDDILDITGDEKVIGKPVLSDEKNKKVTYVTLKGIDKSKEIANQLLEHAYNELKPFCTSKSDFMLEFIEFLKSRKM